MLVRGVGGGGGASSSTARYTVCALLLSRHTSISCRVGAPSPWAIRRYPTPAVCFQGGTTVSMAVLSTPYQRFGTTAVRGTPSLSSAPSPRGSRRPRRSSRGKHHHHHHSSPRESRDDMGPPQPSSSPKAREGRPTPRQHSGAEAFAAHSAPSAAQDEGGTHASGQSMTGEAAADLSEGVARWAAQQSPDLSLVAHSKEQSQLSPDTPTVEEAATTHATSEPGWGLEEVDTITGRTALEELYDRHLTRIHRILEQPLPPMPHDGSVDPDFFVGFASYSYQLRDQYRAVIARELQVPVRAVRLSVAWSGRFNVKRFGRVQKVCGVYLDRGELSTATRQTDTNTDDKTTGTSSSSPSSSQDALSDVLLQRIAAFIAAINTHKREDLLQVQLFQASPPIPEVEFALTRLEHRLVYHLHEWLRRHVLQRAVAVIVYGVPPASLPAPQLSGEVQHHPKQKSAPADSTAHGMDMQHRYDVWRKAALDHTEAQHREIQSRWLRLFHQRKVVADVRSLTELATAVAIAVVRGDCPGLTCDTDSNSAKQNGEAVQLTDSMRDLLVSVAAAAGATKDSAQLGKEAGAGAGSSAATTSIDRDDNVDASVLEETTPSDMQVEPQPPCLCKDVLLPLPAPEQGAGAPPKVLDLTTAEQQEAALRWVRLVFQALLLREAHSDIAAGSSSPSPASITTSRVPLGVSLPALFAQGVYAGSRDEVVYLQHNRAAMDALLLHPHEISFKKKFVSRLRSGHRRQRMEEEAAAPYSRNG